MPTWSVSRQPRIDPAHDIRHHHLLSDVVQEVFEMAVIQLRGLVDGSRVLVEKLTA
jgi:hypothetical protein